MPTQVFSLKNAAFCVSIIADQITYVRAATLPIHRVVELAVKKYVKESEMGRKLLNLYQLIKINYNKYLELTNGPSTTDGSHKSLAIGYMSEETPLLNFLTSK